MAASINPESKAMTNIHINPAQLQAGLSAGNINSFLLCHAPDGMTPEFLFLWPGADGQTAGLLVADDGHALGFRSIDEVVDLFQRLGVDKVNLNYYPGQWLLDDIFPPAH